MARLLIIAAASVFLLLGVVHGALTLADLKNPVSFTPPDPALREAMQRSSIRLNPDINLWKAWLGFNLTHSLGLVLFGAAYLYGGVFKPDAFAGSTLLQAVAVLVSAIYLVVCLVFFFPTPAIAAAVGLACFVAATGLAHA
ncbi:hypothetical protein EDD99_6423 [Streptomyces sp. 846.5]|nr:hypothetical protein [Streptomyces sp. 846.5]TDT98205.1 hypothetical protein EDD99_6423 [Streptomyces sp. 846.5]